jgi:hypothetical protein
MSEFEDSEMGDDDLDDRGRVDVSPPPLSPVRRDASSDLAPLLSQSGDGNAHANNEREAGNESATPVEEPTTPRRVSTEQQRLREIRAQRFGENRT